MALLSAQRLDRRLEGSMGRREILLSGDLFGAFDKMPGVQYLPDVRSNGGRARRIGTTQHAERSLLNVAHVQELVEIRGEAEHGRSMNQRLLRGWTSAVAHNQHSAPGQGGAVEVPGSVHIPR